MKVLDLNAFTDIALIKNVLDSANVEYFFQGGNMKFIQPFHQPAILMINQKDVSRSLIF